MAHERKWRGRPWLAAWLACCVALGGVPRAWSQGAEGAAGANDSSKPKAPEEIDIDLVAKDGVKLRATFYPSEVGEDAVPLVLLHGLGGSRGDWHRFAKLVQEEDGRAVLALDLRGHGESVETGATALTPERLRPADMQAMFELDVEAARRYLLERNEEKELNLERLGVIGAGMGALVALNWAALDWSWDAQPLALGKQGETVKALVLLSPEWAVRGLSATAALRVPAMQRSLPMLVLTGGDDNKALRMARRFDQAIRPHRAHEKDLEVDEQTFLFEAERTSLQGVKLLADDLPTAELIRLFVELRLEKPTLAWRSFKRVAGEGK